MYMGMHMSYELLFAHVTYAIYACVYMYVHVWVCVCMHVCTVDIERSAGLQVCGFNPIEVFVKIYFHIALVISIYYLV